MRLGDLPVGAVMTPRREVSMINLADSPQAVRPRHRPPDRRPQSRNGCWRPSADRTACGRVGQIDHAHFAARRHDGTDGQIAEAHDARDHFLFTGLEHAGILGFDHEGTDFILADLFAGLAALTEQITMPCPIDREATRAGDETFASIIMQGATRTATGFGIAQGDLLRHQFADDERCVGDQGHDGTDPDSIGYALRPAGIDQQAAQPPAERGAGNRARQHADQRDADLDRGEKFSGIGCQRQRAARALDVLSTSAASRAGRDETMASSDIESRPLMTIRTVTIPSSK